MATPITAADYRGKPVAGKRWRRVYRVIIGNPYMGAPVVSLDEEEVTDIEGAVGARPTETLTAMVEMGAAIPLFDPETGLAIPDATMKHSDVYIALYSLYRQLAAARDTLTPP